MEDKIYFSDSDIKRHGVFQDMGNTVNPDGTVDIAKYHWQAEASNVTFDILASLVSPNHRQPEVQRYVISGICVDDHDKAFVFTIDRHEIANIYVSPISGDIWGENRYSRFRLWENKPRDESEETRTPKGYLVTPVLVICKSTLASIGMKTTFERNQGDGSYHVADYTGNINIGKRLWDIKVREEIPRVYDVPKPKIYTAWFAVHGDIRRKFMLSLKDNEVVKLYHDSATGDIWERRVNVAKRIFCEESATFVFE